MTSLSDIIVWHQGYINKWPTSFYINITAHNNLQNVFLLCSSLACTERTFWVSKTIKERSQSCALPYDIMQWHQACIILSGLQGFYNQAYNSLHLAKLFLRLIFLFMSSIKHWNHQSYLLYCFISLTWLSSLLMPTVFAHSLAFLFTTLLSSKSLEPIVAMLIAEHYLDFEESSLNCAGSSWRNYIYLDRDIPFHCNTSCTTASRVWFFLSPTQFPICSFYKYQTWT